MAWRSSSCDVTDQGRKAIHIFAGSMKDVCFTCRSAMNMAWKLFLQDTTVIVRTAVTQAGV